MLSFVYIGIYWNNHHHLFQATENINDAVLCEPPPVVLTVPAAVQYRVDGRQQLGAHSLSGLRDHSAGRGARVRRRAGRHHPGPGAGLDPETGAGQGSEGGSPWSSISPGWPAHCWERITAGS
ncbi:TMEM175 family protein [Kocuria sp. HSID17582]|uniref:TMEM175 family protein n=1 Tax=Kocuria sp. HSID17582 TaxID=2419512 RepID=UPI00352F5EEE